MAMPQADESALQYLCAFVEQMKGSGFVARALRTSGQDGVTVAGPAAPR